jgi:hypothetical protein
VPIQVTELIFPDRRKSPWLRTRGLLIASVVFVAGAVIAWFLWVKIARIQVFHAPDYKPPMLTWLLGWIAVAVLAGVSYLLRAPGTDGTALSRKALSPWVILGATLLLGFPWYILMALVFVPRPLALWIPITATIAWGAMTIALLRRWVSAFGWGERHEWALSLGVLLVCSSAGFLGSSLWPKMDLIFKAVLNVLAVAGMVVLALRIRQRTPA